MRLKTILTLPAMTIRERLRRTREWSAIEFGAHLPLRVRYWVTMQEIVRATRKSPDVLATPLYYVLQNMDLPKEMA